MLERSRPQEAQPSPMTLATESTRGFFEKIENSGDFKKARDTILGQLGNISPESRDAATNMVKSGAGMAMNIVGLLPAFANPEKRKEILEKFKQDKTDAPWVDALANWDVSSDPNGTGVLAECKRLNIAEILEDQNGAETEEQKKQIQLRATAFSKGHDIIAGHYKKQLSSAKKAA